ncbi:unnamed protein product [Durusdinium trenchii]|uniref:JmjC domain-containing protein n=2 Tax=Durusdinium trenchii TaxID=1381693 RepID=A0ABP0LB35_9DINO
MEVLAAPLEQSEIDELLSYFPDFKGSLPEEARYWKKSDLELFLGSNGQLKPKEKRGAASCPFLSRARQRLAELKIGEASAEYLSWCRVANEKALRSAGSACAACAASSCTPVETAKEAPAVPRVPVVVPCPPDWCGRSWTMEFWKTHSKGLWWTCRTRSPAFEHDRRASDVVDVEGSPSEYVDYAMLLQEKDPDCLEENALAFPRLVMDGWCPFVSTEGRALLERHWRELTPKGVKDLSFKWMRAFTAVFSLDFIDYLARFYKISLGAPGCISRLHVTNNGAHTWYTQIQGRRLFILFSPQQTEHLAEEEGGAVDHLEGYAASASSVDIFFPNPKRHSSFSNAKAQAVILQPGETLVVPSGWWHYAVHLDASVTLHHPFWGLQNRARISDELREAFIASKMPVEFREMAARNIAQIHEQIMEDDDDDSDAE